MRCGVDTYTFRLHRRNLWRNGLRGTLPEALGDLAELLDLCVRRPPAYAARQPALHACQRGRCVLPRSAHALRNASALPALRANLPFKPTTKLR
jgi:hypothetical protein